MISLAPLSLKGMEFYLVLHLEAACFFSCMQLTDFLSLLTHILRNNLA